MPNQNAFHDRFLAWFMARGGGDYTSFTESRKRDLMGKLKGTVVEIGSGTGVNLPFLPQEVKTVGVEPNPFMHPHYLRTAGAEERTGLLVQGMAESLPFRDETADAVLSSLVLCSIPDLDQALAEVLRILKPNGIFLFMEHVAAPRGTWLRRFQSCVRPVWRRIGDGCQPDRDTEVFLRRAGFTDLTLERFSIPLPLVSPHIAGIATK